MWSFTLICALLGFFDHRTGYTSNRDRFTDQTGRLTSANRLNCHFCLKFEFILFFPVTSQTGPVHRNWRAPVSSDRSVKKTLDPTSSLPSMSSSTWRIYLCATGSILQLATIGFCPRRTDPINKQMNALVSC